jgi:hypothetical protein
MSKTFVDLVGETQRLSQETASSWTTKIEESVNRYYESLWNRFIWSEVLLVDETCTTVAGQIYAFLPKTVSTVFAITERSLNAILRPSAGYVYQSQYLTKIAAQAGPIGYTHAGMQGVTSEISATGQVSFVSSSSADTTAVVRVYGLTSSGFPFSQEGTLNGTTEVVLTDTYSSVTNGVKSMRTSGHVTIKKSGGSNLEQIGPDEFSNQYIKINLNSPPDAAYTLYVTGKKRFRPLIYDQDIPLIPVDDALILYAWGTMLQQRGKFAQAKELFGQAEGNVSNIIGDRMIQDEMFEQSIPQLGQTVHDVPLLGGGTTH